MIAHLFRKDLKLFWKAALALVLLYLCATIAAATSASGSLLDVLALPLYGGGFCLLTLLVQADPIPSNNADWLIRPIRRRDLLLSKLLFVFALLLVPMFLLDVVAPLLLGFDAGRIFWAAGWRLITVFFGLVLPAMAIAAMTSNLGQCIAGAFVAAFGYSMFMPFLPWSSPRAPIFQHWMEEAAILVVGCVAAVVVLTLQYFGRRTAWSIASVLLACAGLAALARAPWNEFAWPLQANVTPAGDFAKAAAVKFGEQQASVPGGSKLIVNVPVAFDVLSDDAPLILYRAVLQLRFENGKVLEAEALTSEMLVNKSGIRLQFDYGADPDLFELRTMKLEANLTAWLAAMKDPATAQELLIDAKAEHVPDAGLCSVSAAGITDSMLQCLQVGETSFLAMDLLPLSQDAMSPVFLRYAPTVFTQRERLITGREPVKLKPIRFVGALERRVSVKKWGVATWETINPASLRR